MSFPNGPEREQFPTTDRQHKPYRSPELAEYGDIQQITHGDSGSNIDFPSGSRKDTL